MIAVALTFLLFGSFWGGWAVVAADVEHELGLSHGAFGLLLSAALAAATVAQAAGGSLAERHGTGPVLAGALGGWAVLLLTGSVLHSPLWFGVAVVGVVAMGGVVDVVMNTAATAALANRPGDLVRFHGLFNAGAAGGAALAGVLAGAGAWRWGWALAGVLALVLAARCRRSALPAGEPGERVPLTGAVRALRQEHLVLLAGAFALGAVVEGGIELWGVLFLRTRLESGILVGAGSAVVAYSVAAAARVVLGPVAGRQGAARGVTAGAGAAAVGILVLALSSQPLLAGAGLVVAAGGISMCWPLLLAHATAGRARPGTVVGGVTSVGYLGFVLGPAVVGWLAGGIGLRAGLATLAAAAVLVAAAPYARRLQRVG